MNPNWDERYGLAEFAYGKSPNTFFEEWLNVFEPGAILMGADGEGRNGVYAAQQGWQVTSFDLSIEGKTKALQLASERDVAIDYVVGDLEDLTFENEGYDALGLIYAHFPADRKIAFHHKLDTYLRPGGIVIFEAFSKSHLKLREQNPEVGGPPNIDMLFSEEEITQSFTNYEFLLLEEKEIDLQEGNYHNGRGSVIRFVGKKLS